MNARRVLYEANGYLLVENLVSAEQLAELKRDTADIFRGKYGTEGIQPVADNATDEEAMQNYLAIHQPHKISAIQKRYMFHPPVLNVLTEIIGSNVKCMQSMLFVKPPGFPGQAWHQDERYIPTEDRSLTGAWIAIDDATEENGCLWVIPGSHTGEILPTGPQPSGDEYDGIGEMCIGVDESLAVPAEAPAGSVLFFNGFLLHASKKNRSDRFRRALVCHYMNADYPLRWCGQDDYRDIEMVAGVDKFAERGKEDIATPWLRPRQK